MKLSIALIGLLTGAAAAAGADVGAAGTSTNANRGSRKMSSSHAVESASSNSLTASTVVRAQRSVERAVKTAKSMADRKRRRQLVATKAVLLGVARRAYHERQRDLQDDTTGMPSDMSDMDLSAIEDMLESMGITVPEDANGNPDFEALAAQFGIDLDSMGGDMTGDGDMSDMMGDFDMGDFDLDSLLGDDFSLEDLMGGGDGMGGGDDMDKDLDDLMGDTDMNMDDLDALFGGLFGDGEDGDPASGIGSFICGFMGMIEEEAGQTCDCDASSGDLVLKCSSTEEICDLPPEGTMQMDGIQGMEFCVSSFDSTVIIPLDFMDGIFDEDGNMVEGGGTTDEDTPEASVESCAVYSAPAFVKGKEFCFKATIDLDMDEMMGDTTTTMGDETAAMGNLSELIECEASIDGQDCESCSICDDGLGIDLNCPGPGLFSEGCTDVMSAGDGAEGEGTSPTDGLPTTGTGTSIVRFAQATDDSSPAANIYENKSGAVFVGAILSLALFVASV